MRDCTEPEEVTNMAKSSKTCTTKMTAGSRSGVGRLQKAEIAADNRKKGGK